MEKGSHARKPQTKGTQTMGKVHKITNHHRKAFAERLRARRKLFYETAAQFAAVLGIDQNRYRSWEQAVSEPSYAHLIHLCQLLRCTPNDLLLGPAKSGTGNGGKNRKKTKPITLKPAITRHIGPAKFAKA